MNELLARRGQSHVELSRLGVGVIVGVNVEGARVTVHRELHVEVGLHALCHATSAAVDLDSGRARYGFAFKADDVDALERDRGAEHSATGQLHCDVSVLL